MRTVFWDYDRDVMKMIDQRLLPFELVVPEYTTWQDVAAGIRDMVVRGAPAIGIAAAWGVVLA
ncbi:MAG TPA: S-methyl-5-thioribose-1-phosphate isomerase, partial [Promineifilum sp.]|nr:S-methyl-5-thioribose-1-phosphate isomerase [Promineifilum sp.]